VAKAWELESATAVPRTTGATLARISTISYRASDGTAKGQAQAVRLTSVALRAADLWRP
jgi:hypothetical protein